VVLRHFVNLSFRQVANFPKNHDTALLYPFAT
jgi:hypothetical protein